MYFLVNSARYRSYFRCPSYGNRFSTRTSNCRAHGPGFRRIRFQIFLIFLRNETCRRTKHRTMYTASLLVRSACFFPWNVTFASCDWRVCHLFVFDSTHKHVHTIVCVTGEEADGTGCYGTGSRGVASEAEAGLEKILGRAGCASRHGIFQKQEEGQIRAEATRDIKGMHGCFFHFFCQTRLCNVGKVFRVRACFCEFQVVHALDDAPDDFLHYYCPCTVRALCVVRSAFSPASPPKYKRRFRCSKMRSLELFSYECYPCPSSVPLRSLSLQIRGPSLSLLLSLAPAPAPAPDYDFGKCYSSSQRRQRSATATLLP